MVVEDTRTDMINPQQVQEIKKLNQQIQMVQSEMTKHNEALDDCLKVRWPQQPISSLGHPDVRMVDVVLACGSINNSLMT